MNKQCDGIVYKITDLFPGQFYIGETQKKRWDKGYMGSGTHWIKHCNKYPNHKYKREIVHNNIKDYNELYCLEINEIRKHCVFKEGKWIKINDLILNHKFSIQPDIAGLTPCSECRALKGHTKLCSQYIEREICSECGSRLYSHKKNCLRRKISTLCPECGYSLQSHKHAKSCSKYKESKSCPECGSRSTHKKTCSQYRSNYCSECGSRTKHKSWYPNKKLTI